LNTSEPSRYKLPSDDAKAFEILKADFKRGIRQDIKMGDQWVGAQAGGQSWTGLEGDLE